MVLDGYHEAALYILKKAKEIGLEDVRIIKFLSDGKYIIYYSKKRSRPKWTLRKAVLNLVSPVKKRLVSWEENPITLATNSLSVDIEAELVDVAEGVHASDYEGKDVRGKLVLASSPQGKGRIELVHKLAVLERGACGVVSYRSYFLVDFPELITWDHIWTLELNNNLSTFGFCTSKRTGWELRRLLQSGEKVNLQAKVDAELSCGEYEIVTGVISGKNLEDKEIWFTAHLDHCLLSANDNASGSPAILETAQTLLESIRKGILKKPEITLRFIWVPEIDGTYAYVSKHPEETGKVAMMINMDMVGENQMLCGSVFNVEKTPESTPSFLNDLLETALNFMLSHNIQIDMQLKDPLAVFSPTGTRESWSAKIVPFSGGSDHIVFMGGVINVPAAQFGSWPDYFYHSSGDTPDKCDPTQLKRAVVLGALIASSIMSINSNSGVELVNLMFPNCLRRLDEALGRAMELIHSSDLSQKSFKEAMNVLEWSIIREKEALLSVSMLLPDADEVKRLIYRYNEKISEYSHSLRKIIDDYYLNLCQKQGKKVASLKSTEEENLAKKLIPLRNPAYPGPVDQDYINGKIEEEELKVLTRLTKLQLFEIGAFIDGKKSILDIRNVVSAECGFLKLSDVLSYLNLLKEIGLITYK